MPIYPQGSLNATSLVVPDLYVQIVAPQNLVLNGVPTNVIGAVGTASWGPVDQPVAISTMADYGAGFGPVMARKYDMGTAVATAVQQGASAFRCVRVTDGTDAAASFAVDSAGGNYAVLLTALYTGSLGNTISVSLMPASTPGLWQFSVTMPGLLPEVYSNIPSPTPAAFWQNLVNAINMGNGQLRGPSSILMASLGTATASSPTGFSQQFLGGGSDGASGATSATLVGQDTIPRSGMYALRAQGCGLGVLADLDDATQWSTEAAFGLSEGVYMIMTCPAGQSIAMAISSKQLAGVNSYAAKLMFGDWIYWNDQTNNLTRLVSPQGFVAGRLANLSPEQSSLNKPLYSIVGTQKSGSPGSGQTSTYSEAELGQLFANGIDVISNPQPGGSYWGVRCGHNTSSNAATSGDNYTRLTNYVAATLAAGMGAFVGQVINSGLFKRIRSTQLSFLQNLYSQGVLGSIDGSLPFSVICDASNNPSSRTGLGFVQSDAQVQFQAINEKFVVNVEGGQTVAVQRQVLPGGSA